MINELTILEINKEENLLNVVLHESYAIGRGAFALPPYVSTNAKRQLVTLDYLNEALASFSGGGGGTINTSNGISGDGSSGNPVILEGQLNQATNIDLNGQVFQLGINNNIIGIDDTNNAAFLQGSDGIGNIATLSLSPNLVQLTASNGVDSTTEINMSAGGIIQLTGMQPGSPVSLLGLDGSNNIVLGSLSGVTAGNGLSIDGDTGAVFLGGSALTENVFLDTNGQTFQIGIGNNGIEFDDGINVVQAYASDGTAQSTLDIEPSLISLVSSDGGSNSIVLTLTPTIASFSGLSTGVAVNGLGIDADGNIVLTVI